MLRYLAYPCACALAASKGRMGRSRSGWDGGQPRVMDSFDRGGGVGCCPAGRWSATTSAIYGVQYERWFSRIRLQSPNSSHPP
jgi:hypothetical protein